MRHTIRTNILTIFLLLIGLVSVSLLSSQYYFSQKLAKSATEKTFEIISKNITDKISSQNSEIVQILQSNSENTSLLEKIHIDYNHPALTILTHIMTSNPSIYATYFAHEDGSFYEVVNLNESKTLGQIFSAPSQSHWMILVHIENELYYFYLSKELILLSERLEHKPYNPLERPWYKSAYKSSNVVITGPYIFSNLQQAGTSYSIKLPNASGVFAIDYRLERFNNYLALQRFEENSEIFLFNKEAQIIASSNPNQKQINPLLTKALLQNNHETISYSSSDGDYFAINKPLLQDIYLAITMDKDRLLEPYRMNLLYALLIAAILLLISLPIIIYATTIIIKPIKELIEQNELIKKRVFTDVTPIKTDIIEFIELSNSMVSMSQSISTYQESQEKMLDAIVKLIADAIDAKSPYTAGHCKRVPELALMLLKSANKSQSGIFQEFSLNDKDALREFELGAWLHDCGKVTTPEYVVDKSTKLETIYNRIHEVRTRFEVLHRDAQIEYLKELLDGHDKKSAAKKLQNKHQKLQEEFAFVAQCNVGGEYFSDEDKEYLEKIANREWLRYFDDTLGLGPDEHLRKSREKHQPLPTSELLLADKSEHIILRESFDFTSYEESGFLLDVPEYQYNQGELYNLSIERGTLTPEERYKINEHIIMTIKMLESIPFPEHLRKIPEYAGTHHETLIGTGYPRKLSEKELSVPARIMALCDIFEALTASDRPYKKAKTLSESLKIMSYMVKDKHIDADIFRLFLEEGIYLEYGKLYLDEAQIDEVKIEEYLS
ncbi:MAG: amino acid ABC transporter [Campylobacterales bacterium]|nr:amino acid ABC transporter [Campylobacterales bacterium]